MRIWQQADRRVKTTPKRPGLDMFPPDKERLITGLLLADVQAGSRLSPYPPGLELRDEAHWGLSKGQKYLWEKWTNMLSLLPDELDFFIHLGETVQGPQMPARDTVELITKDSIEQGYIARALLGPIARKVKKCDPDCPICHGTSRAWWSLRGSNWHEGEYGQAADAVAEALGAHRFPNGSFSGDILDLALGPFDMNFSHHHSVFIRYRTSSLEREIGFFSESAPQAEKGDGTLIDNYDLIARGHVHKFTTVEIDGHVAVSCPGWQLQIRHATVRGSIARSWPDLGFVLVYLDPVAKRQGRRGIWLERILYPHPRRTVVTMKQ